MTFKFDDPEVGFGLAQIKRQGDIIEGTGGELTPEDDKPVEIYISKNEFLKIINYNLQLMELKLPDKLLDYIWDDLKGNGS